MFENVKPPEDMFAGVEPGAAPPQPPLTPPSKGGEPMVSVPPAPSAPTGVPLPSKEAQGVVPSSETEAMGKKFLWKPVVIALGAMVVVGAAAAIAYALMSSRTTVVPEQGEAMMEEKKDEGEAMMEEKKVEVMAEEKKAEEAMMEQPDRDKDGLTDAEEVELGTSPSSTDTDGDGLFDKEEVETYKTNPLNPDTDGDTYLDGTEVKSGYDPNGPGKLFEVPSE